VEFKRKGKSLEPGSLQEWEFQEMTRLGIECYVMNDKIEFMRLLLLMERGSA
jgi:hypothetical protein